MLAAAGGAVGLLLAVLGLDLLVAFAERFTPRAAEITIDTTRPALHARDVDRHRRRVRGDSGARERQDVAHDASRRRLARQQRPSCGAERRSSWRR